MKIPYQKYTLYIKALEPLYLPYYKGSTFRGGFGNAFKKLACPLKLIECKECILKTKCIYLYIFETIPPDNTNIFNMNKYEKIPHPFVIEPPESKDNFFPEGKTINFNLILFGSAIDYIPYFIYTFEILGKIGIGKGRGKFTVAEVRAVDEVIYKNGILKKITPKLLQIPFEFQTSETFKNLTLHILTPMRIKYNRKFISELDFHILMRNILRRISTIGYFHCGGQLPEFPVKEIIQQSEKIKIVNSNLKWYDWERYSSRQDTRMKLGGIVGEITYEGNITPFLPFLKAGEILHVGKGTSFGLGKYEITEFG